MDKERIVPEITKLDLIEFLEEKGASPAALSWLNAQEGTIEEIHNDCRNFDWLYFLYRQIGLPTYQDQIDKLNEERKSIEAKITEAEDFHMLDKIDHAQRMALHGYRLPWDQVLPALKKAVQEMSNSKTKPKNSVEVKNIRIVKKQVTDYLVENRSSTISAERPTGALAPPKAQIKRGTTTKEGDERLL